MGDHTAEAKDEASSAGNTAAASRTGARGDDDSATGCSSHAENKAARRTGVLGGDDSVRGLSSHAGNTAARRAVAHRDEESVRHAAASGALPSRRGREDTVPVAGADERGPDGDPKKRKKADSTVPVVLGGGISGSGVFGGDDSVHGMSSHAGNTASSRTGVHIGDHSARGCSSYTENKAARRTVAYGDEEIVRHAAASGALPSRRAREDTAAAPGAGLDGDAKKRGKKCSAAQEGGEGVKKSRSSAAEASRAEGTQGSVKHQKKEPRLIDRYDMAVANKNAMAAVGGKMPALLRLAAEYEAIKAAARRMEAITRRNQMARGVVAAPSRVPVQRRPQPQPQTDPEPQPQGQPQPQPDPEPQLELRPLLQQDRSCPRCHISSGTVAPHHLCKCMRCSKSTDLCPFCVLAALPKIEQARGMCSSCGRRAGKLALDHVCLCDTCHDCPMCDLAKLPRPLPRWEGACPCCLENAGNASSHLCLCLKCRLVPGSACPFCALAEASSPLKPFDAIRRIAYSLK